MADPREIQQANQQIAEALSYGANEEDIYNHLRQSGEPHHMEIVRRYDIAEGMKRAAALNGQQPESEDQNQLSKVSQWVINHPIESAVGTAALGSAAYLGKKVLLDPIIEARKAAAIAKAQAEAPMSAAVEIQARQLDLAEQKFQADQAAAQQAKQDLAQPTTPAERPKTELELIAEEHARVKLEADKAKMAREAELHQAKLEGLARKAAAELQKGQGQASSVNSPANEQSKQMMESSVTAQVQKETDNLAKAKAAAAPPAEVPTAPVTPPSVEPATIGQVPAAETITPTELTTPEAPVEQVAKPTTNEPPVVTNQEIVEARVPPEGKNFQYKPNPKKGIMGPSAYNWMNAQEGPKTAEVWANLVGNKNMSYNDFQKNVAPIYEGYIGSYGDPDPFAQVAKRGSYKTPTLIPKNIKGSASLKAMFGLAATAGLLGVAGSEKGQQAMARAANAIKDIGISPDIFLGKGEEIGRLGSAYVTAGNPSYRAELLSQMKTEKNPARYQELLNEYTKSGGNVPGGRGISPPSSYPK